MQEVPLRMNFLFSIFDILYGRIRKASPARGLRPSAGSTVIEVPPVLAVGEKLALDSRDRPRYVAGQTSHISSGEAALNRILQPLSVIRGGLVDQQSTRPSLLSGERTIL